MRMRRVLGVLAALVLSGCSSIDIPSDTNPEYVGSPSGLISYGIDNGWMDIDAGELGDALVGDGKCTMTSIEFLGWADRGYYKDPTPLFAKFDDFLSAMRKRKVWVFVSICNDNKGLGKYGDDNNGLDKYKTQLTQVVAYLKSKGPEGLIIQPVAETRTSTGSWMEQYCVQQLVGFKLCWNHGSRPTSAPSGWWTFAYHPGSLSDKGKPNGLTITDHSAALREGEVVPEIRAINIGGDLYGYADPVKLEAYAKEVLKTKDRGFGYYGFGHKKIDKEAIKAIGQAVKAVR